MATLDPVHAQITDLFHHMALRRRPPTDEASKAHGFWDKQPVPKLAEKPGESAPIEVKEVKDVRQKPYKLPGGFEWCEVDPAKEDKVSVARGCKPGQSRIDPARSVATPCTAAQACRNTVPRAALAGFAWKPGFGHHEPGTSPPGPAHPSSAATRTPPPRR